MERPKGQKKPMADKKRPGKKEKGDIFGGVQDELKKLQTYLQNSEWTLIQFMIKKNKWIPGTKTPVAPANYDPANSNIDLGLFAYWLNNPSKLELYKDYPGKITLLILGLIYENAMPVTQMTDSNYAFLQNPDNGFIYTDGSVLNAELYATYDQEWFTAFLNLLETLRNDAWYFKPPYPPIKAKPIALGSGKSEIKIAVLGDWGSGQVEAKAVMESLKAQQPDYIIHLGDVYYSGTPDLNGANGSIYFNPGEETAKLVNLWPSGFTGKSFTMNSNHEMYSGANGLFDALRRSRSPFSAQQGESCFCLTFGGWNLLGLDSAFMSSSTNAFMDGDIGDSGSPQVTWIKNLKLDPKKTIVFTHHNGFEYDGSGGTKLWNQVVDSIGGDPYAWYWGHVHNALVYKQPIVIPPSGNFHGFTTRTFARCSGHAAIPYGNASALNDNTQIVYRPKTTNPNNGQLYNGYNLLVLKSTNNDLKSITEAFFDIGPGRQPGWVKVLFAKA